MQIHTGTLLGHRVCFLFPHNKSKIVQKRSNSPISLNEQFFKMCSERAEIFENPLISRGTLFILQFSNAKSNHILTNYEIFEITIVLYEAPTRLMNERFYLLDLWGFEFHLFSYRFRTSALISRKNVF